MRKRGEAAKKRYIHKMDVLAAYKVGITVLIPVFSAITCGALVVLSLRDCLSQEERRLKEILLVYLSLSLLNAVIQADTQKFLIRNKKRYEIFLFDQVSWLTCFR